MGFSPKFVAVVIVGLLAASSALAAGATKIRQTGSVKGDSGASAKLVLIKNDKGLKSVKNVKIKNLRADCSAGEARIRLSLSGPAKIDDTRRFKETYKAGKGKIKLSGRVKRDGSKVHGSIKGSTIQTDGAGRCDVPTFDFTTKR